MNLKSYRARSSVWIERLASELMKKPRGRGFEIETSINFWYIQQLAIQVQSKTKIMKQVYKKRGSRKSRRAHRKPLNLYSL